MYNGRPTTSEENIESVHVAFHQSIDKSVRTASIVRHGLANKDTYKTLKNWGRTVFMHFKLLMSTNYYKTHGESLNMTFKHQGQ